MNQRQARIAAALINASYLAHTDTPEEIEGVSSADVDKIVEATNAAGWAVLERYGLERAVSKEQAVAIALAYPVAKRARRKVDKS